MIDLRKSQSKVSRQGWIFFERVHLLSSIVVRVVWVMIADNWIKLSSSFRLEIKRAIKSNFSNLLRMTSKSQTKVCKMILLSCLRFQNLKAVFLVLLTLLCWKINSRKICWILKILQIFKIILRDLNLILISSEGIVNMQLIVNLIPSRLSMEIKLFEPINLKSC